MRDCTRIYRPPGRLLPPCEGQTRGQLTAAGSFGFSFSLSPGGKFYKTRGSQTLVVSQGCPVSIVRHFFANLPFCLTSDIFSRSLRVSSGANWLRQLHLHFQTETGQVRSEWIGEDKSPTKTLVSWDQRVSGINWTVQIVYYTSLIELICKYVYWANWVF